MAYTFSEGQSGALSTIAINTTGSTYVAIEEALSIAQSGNDVTMIPSTNLQSVIEESIPGLPSSGEFKVTCIRVDAATATGQQLVQTQFNLGSLQAPIKFQLTLAKDAAAGQTTAGDSAIFSAYVSQCTPFGDVSPNKL